MGGIVNSQIVDAKQIDLLSKLPSLDELRAKIIGLLQTPATNIAGILNTPASNLARVFKAFADK